MHLPISELAELARNSSDIGGVYFGAYTIEKEEILAFEDDYNTHKLVFEHDEKKYYFTYNVVQDVVDESSITGEVLED